jgi:hypothetical protein
MVETLEHLIAQAAQSPKHSRQALYKELLRSETFLLSIGEPLGEDKTRVIRGPETFSVWADKDQEMGGVWVPLFPARDAVAHYVASRKLSAPKDKEFLWMGHEPGEVFGLMRSVRFFAGLKLILSDTLQVPLAWPEVKALAEGRVPDDEPHLYELPVTKLTIPTGMRIAFGHVDAGQAGHDAKLLCLPEAGHFHAEDTRRLVRLQLGGEGNVWMACRHFLQVLKFIEEAADSNRYLEDMIRSLVGFEMYGEAEALCDWLASRSNEAYAWVCLAAIYGKTGRLAECAALCKRGAVKYPDEKSFRINGARALAALDRIKEATKFIDAGLERFPDEAALLELKKRLA